MKINNRTIYLAPTLKFADFGGGRNNVICASGEKTKLPQGIGIADYTDIVDSGDSDW